VGGCEVFMADKPEVIASKYLPARLDKYRMLAQHRNRISAQQFDLPEIKLSDVRQDKIYSNFVYPTKTFLGEMTFTLGDKTFELHTTRAETDDACWVWIPEINAAFIGDLIIGSFPNIGNPWKPTRFALDWAKALEEVRAKEPEIIFASGAGIMYKNDEVSAVLDANIEAIRNMHDQVVDCINKSIHITEMIHKVKLPEHLKNNPHLRFLYSRPEFFVYNVYRWYHGYFDGNPANLLPRPEKEVMNQIYKIINNPEKILNSAQDLFNQNQVQLGLQILDILIQADPENIDARKLRIRMLKKLGSRDYCLMSRNAWVYFIKKDKKFIRSREKAKTN
jgi:alkyl sulfatase BDS1-like metallo-beta-lactamase superfamily hydrolase